MAINDLKLNVELDNNMNIYATCKQFDDLNIILSMFKGGLSANLEEYKVRLKATKSDQVPLIQEHTGITISQNVVTITADKQLTNVAGNTVIEMQFIDKTTNKKKSTYNIILQVYNSTLEEDRSISKSTYTLLERLEDKLDQAGDFYENIDKGITLNDNLKNSINIGDTLKTNLDNKITTGSILNNDLETNISTGNTLKPNLEGAVTTANNVKAELDASIQNANKFASEHGDIIDLDNRVTQNTSKLNYNTQNIDDIRTNYAKKIDVNDLANNKADKTDLELTNTNITKNTNDIATQKARIDSFTSLAQGSTTGDAELIDSRIGTRGETYKNSGDSIRNQLSLLIEDSLYYSKDIDLSTSTDGYVDVSGNYHTDTAYHTSPIELRQNETIKLYGEGHSTNVSMIAKVVNGKYTPLVTCLDDELKWYKYTADTNMNVVLSFINKDKAYAYIVKKATETQKQINSLNNQMNTNTNDVKELQSNKIDVSFLDIESKVCPTTTDDCYINKSGKKISGSSSNHVLSEKIQLNKGDVITVNCIGVADATSIITQDLWGKYIPLKVADTDSMKKYNYEALEDMYIVISAHRTWDKTYKIYNKLNKNQIKDLYDTLPSFSMFEKFGVIGDSFASGEVWDESGKHSDYYNISWGQILARMSGNKCINFSEGGLTTETWLTSEKGLNLLNSSEVQQLYICALGINDYYKLGEKHLGTIADCETKADSFYGYYARIIEAIQTKAPKSKIVMMTIAYKSEVSNKYSNAIINIANKYGIPYIIQGDDRFFNDAFYYNNMVGGHPLAVVYSGMAKAFKRLIETCMQNNVNYFKNYTG